MKTLNKFRIFFFTLFIGITLNFFFSLDSLAATATLDSITPDAQDLSGYSYSGPGSNAPEGVKIFTFGDQSGGGTNYTAVFSVDSEPAVVCLVGGYLQDWTYDAATGKLTVTLEYTGILQALSSGYDVFSIGMAWPSEDGYGPPLEMTGAYMTTNVLEWELIPPSQEDLSFGYKLSGPAGASGFFIMYIPDTMLNLLGQYSGETLTFGDLAVFVDGDQASVSVTEVSDGALVSINVTFTQGNTEAADYTASSDNYGGGAGSGDSSGNYGGDAGNSGGGYSGDTGNYGGAGNTGQPAYLRMQAASKNVSKTITARKKLPLSLTALEDSIKKGKAATLYGWLESGKKNQNVILWTKPAGQKSFRKIKTVKTQKDGYFSYSFKPASTAGYQATYMKEKSPTQKITVK